VKINSHRLHKLYRYKKICAICEICGTKKTKQSFEELNLIAIKIMAEDNYIPGTCNIGNEQLTKRKQFAVKCILGTLLCILFLQLFHLNKMWRLPVFILFTASAIGVQQVFYKFCYVFGLKGLYGFLEADKVKSVEGEEYRKLDRAKARRMLISSLLIGLILTVIYYFLPF